SAVPSGHVRKSRIGKDSRFSLRGAQLASGKDWKVMRSAFGLCVRCSTLTFLVLIGGSTRAQDETELSCSSRNIASVPSRPTVTSATDTTQCGVLEVEYGLERQWVDGDARHDDLSGGVRFGITPNLDVHWASGDFLNFTDQGGSRTGFGDTWVG